MTEPEKLPLTSMDVAAQRREELKALFPSVFTETKNEAGDLVESIDFEKLKAELGTISDVYESRRERYVSDWPGKKDCIRLIQQSSRGTLKPCRNESVNFDTTENLFIEGDNLEVLKILQKSLFGSVKMIFIDPPYNTGNDLVYPDEYSETLETYLEYAGLIDGDGRKISSNTQSEGRFHTRWLNMMYPRLYLARNLLREDGVLFVTIDDNEVTNLKNLLNEIFGEENFIACMIWQKMDSPSRNDPDRSVSNYHDYVLVYGRNKSPRCIKKMPKEDILEGYTIELPDGRMARRRQLRKNGKGARREDRPTLYYALTAPDGAEVYPIAPSTDRDPGGWEGRWVLSKDTWEERSAEGLTQWIKRDYGWVPYYLETAPPSPGIPWPTLLTEVDQNRQAKAKFTELMGSTIEFDNPKPTDLLRTFIRMCMGPDDICLDFFAGSGSMAHAILESNRDDSTSRKFIAVQLPEPLERVATCDGRELRTIADIAKSRIRRAIGQIEAHQEDSLLGDEGQLPEDLGFRVLKLHASRFRIWDAPAGMSTTEDIARQLTLHVDHIDPNASAEDVLFELLLKAGFPPNERYQQIELAGHPVFAIADSSLLIFLEDEITRELIDAVAEAEPMQFICLDRAFKGNDQLKANAVQTFAARNQGREKAEQIIFRTV